MKVGELRKQGFKAIAGDTLTNGLSDSIKLSIGGAIAVNEGHHDELEVVDLLWRDQTSEEHGFSGASDYSLDGWRPYFGSLSNTDKPAVAIDEKPIFTQAMADAGELPNVGSKLNLRIKTDLDRVDEFFGLELTIIGVATTSTGEPVITWEHPRKGVCCGLYSTEYFKPIDNRTEKQKAVDAAVDAVEKKGFIANDLLAATEAFGIAFDAGLLHLQSNEQ